jgi:glyoxylate utilization-related uncharacterized protein
VEAADLTDFVRFSSEAPTRETVFESDRLWCQIVCLDRNQSLGPLGDPRADCIVTVIAGEAVILVDRRRKRLKQWGAVLVPAAAELVMTNASAEPAVMLLVTAPPPLPGAERPG